MSNAFESNYRKAQQYKKMATSSKAELDDMPTKEQSSGAIATRMIMILVGAAVFYYSGLIEYLQKPNPLVNQTAFLFGTVAFGIMMICMLLILIWKHIIQRGTTYSHVRIRARRPLMIIVLCWFISLVAFSVAFWPVYGWKGPFLLGFLSYCGLCVLSFV